MKGLVSLLRVRRLRYPPLMQVEPQLHVEASSPFSNPERPPKSRNRSAQDEREPPKDAWTGSSLVKTRTLENARAGERTRLVNKNVSNKKTYPRFEDSRPSEDPSAASRFLRSATTSSEYTSPPSRNPRRGFNEASQALTFDSSSVRV